MRQHNTSPESQLHIITTVKCSSYFTCKIPFLITLAYWWELFRIQTNYLLITDQRLYRLRSSITLGDTACSAHYPQQIVKENRSELTTRVNRTERNQNFPTSLIWLSAFNTASHRLLGAILAGIHTTITIRWCGKEGTVLLLRILRRGSIIQCDALQLITVALNITFISHRALQLCRPASVELSSPSVRPSVCLFVCCITQQELSYRKQIARQLHKH